MAKPTPHAAAPARRATLPDPPVVARIDASDRSELCLMLVPLVLGCVLRFAFPAGLAIEHFDEGVYASNYWFGPEQDYRYPNQELYAPPLLPALIEWTFILTGPSNLKATLPCLLAGCLTVLLVWRVSRAWCGPAAGLAAALLAATSDLHLLFSRSALTDVLLCFWLLLAVAAYHRALLTAAPRAVIVAGVATGLAWWTKYNGWLPLAIGLAGTVGATLAHRHLPGRSAGSVTRPENALPPRAWLIWGGVAVIALVVWLPWLWDLQDRGGYAAVARNHRGYLVGWSGWWDSLQRQLANHRALDSILGAGGVLLACLLPGCLSGITSTPAAGRFTWNETWRRFVTGPARVPVFLGGAVCIIAGLVSVNLAVGLMAVAGVGLMIRPGGDDSQRSEPARRLAGWLLAAWFLGLLISTPLYTPYPRLTLPWLMSAWLGAGAFIGRMWDIAWASTAVPSTTADRTGEPDSDPRRATVGWHLAPAVIGGALLLLVGLLRPDALPVPALESRTGLADVAEPILQAACRDAQLPSGSGREQIATYVYGEPALLFQLRLVGAEHVAAVSHLAFAKPGAPAAPLPIFLVTGPHAEQTEQFAEQLQVARPRLRLVTTFEYHPSMLVRLDSPEPDSTEAQRQTLSLYRVE